MSWATKQTSHWKILNGSIFRNEKSSDSTSSIKLVINLKCCWRLFTWYRFIPATSRYLNLSGFKTMITAFEQQLHSVVFGQDVFRASCDYHGHGPSSQYQSVLEAVDVFWAWYKEEREFSTLSSEILLASDMNILIELIDVFVCTSRLTHYLTACNQTRLTD